MDLFERWENSFLVFLALFASLFSRSEPREQMRKYVRGLLGAAARKNGWQLAEQAGDAVPDRMQRLNYRAAWDADQARDILRDYTREQLGDPEGVGILDETGFVKKGTCSVGVKRQYSGTAGRTENCQIGVFLAYATPNGQTLLDRRLYLPEDWCADQERRKKANVPKEVAFQTKPALGLGMLHAAWAAEVPMRWVTGDAIYGDSPTLRRGIDEAGRWYVLGVTSTTPVWVTRPAVAIPPWSGKGRRAVKPQVADAAPDWMTVASAIATLPASSWHRITLKEGEKGAITYGWARMRVVERVEGLPGRSLWVLARRSVTDPTDIKYFLSNAPTSITLPTLARVASIRFAVEQCFEEAKGENGLDEYEVRLWQSWYRHVTLAMMAHAWLTVQRARDATWVPDEVASAARQKRGPGSVSAVDSARSAPVTGNRSVAA